jgi:bacteriorhodopsin
LGFIIFDYRFIMFIISWIFYLVEVIVVCTLVYTDAKQRDMNATNMLLLVIFLGPIGGLIYLVLRRNYEL